MKLFESKYFNFLALALMIVLVIYVLTLINEKSETSLNTIYVTGTAELYATPDVGLVNISVLTENKDLSVASNEASEKMNTVIVFLKTEGVEQKDIKTTGFNINPRYEWNNETGKRTLVGYEVSQTVNVKIRDLTKTGKIISESVSKGANDVSSLSFIVDNDDQLKEDVKNLAIKDAKEKAKNLEKSLGVKLNKIVNFSENSYSPYVSDYGYGGGMMKEAMTSSVVPTIETGQNKLTSTVTITYSVK
jgi:uncharacterized protein